MNSDDVTLPGALHQVAQAFSQHPNTETFIGAYDFTDENHIMIGKQIDPIPIDGERMKITDSFAGNQGMNLGVIALQQWLMERLDLLFLERLPRNLH